MSSTARRFRACLLSAVAIVAASACATTRRAAPIVHAGPWKGALDVVIGREVEVVGFDGRRLTGRLADVTDEGVTVRTGPTSVEHRDRATVSRVSLLQRGGGTKRNGALIGAAIGVGYVLGAITYYTSGDDGISPPEGSAMLALGAGIGAGVVAVADELEQGTTRRTIYDASLPRKR